MQQGWVKDVLPFVVIAVVIALRWRGLKKARRLRVGMLWIVPLLVVAAIGMALVAMPPTPLGWLVFAAGLAAGAAVGWQRARLMHLHRDPASGELMMRQTPAALLLLLAIFAMRRLVNPGGSGPAADGTIAPTALLVTDGLLGFALGMVIALRLTLYLRAREH